LSQPQLTRQTRDPSHDQDSLIKKKQRKSQSLFKKKSYDEIEKENKSKEKENNVNHVNFSNS